LNETIEYVEQKQLANLMRKHKITDDYDLTEALMFMLCIDQNMALDKILI